MQNINKFTEVYIFVPSITIRRKLPYMESRVKEIDYLKCIFITLMIIFHLVYIGDKYPYAKQIVYTFHMSAFLIISGYLANNRKDARSFLRKFLWIFIPYACMEAAYTVMSHFLPVRESVDAITPTVLLDKIFLHPMGPYWYLHTLILCSLIYYITFRYVRLSVVSRLVVTGVCLFALSHWGCCSLSLPPPSLLAAAWVWRGLWTRYTFPDSSSGRVLYCVEAVHVSAHKGKFHHKLLFVLKNLHQRAV